MRIAVSGTGYVGLSSAMLFSQNHEVVAIDIVSDRVDMLNRGKSPIIDPEIEDFLQNKDLNFKATLNKEGGEMEIVVNKPKDWGEYIIPKGYVALNGVSLTVGKVTEDKFSVFLIPETIESTNLLTIEKGATLNLEVDQAVMSLYEKELKVLKRIGGEK